MATDPIIDLRGLRKHYGRHVALRGIELQLGGGEVVGVVGPDGAGKTPLIRVLAGLLEIEADRALVLGHDLRGDVTTLKAQTGYVPQLFSLHRSLSIFENLSFTARVHRLPRSELTSRAAALLARTGLTPFADRAAGALSGGMKQKLAVVAVGTPAELRASLPLDAYVAWADEIFAFLGANGSGKSTTIRMLIGLLQPTAGEIEVAGIDVIQWPRKVRDHIGYMGQKVSLYAGLSLRENVEFYAGLYDLSAAELAQRWGALRERFALAEAEHEKIDDLPGAVRQRAGLALSTIHQPQLLFLDEPTAGVDVHSRGLVWDLIAEEAAAGVTVFVTTHFLEEVDHCDWVSFIHAKSAKRRLQNWISTIL